MAKPMVIISGGEALFAKGLESLLMSAGFSVRLVKDTSEILSGTETSIADILILVAGRQPNTAVLGQYTRLREAGKEGPAILLLGGEPDDRTAEAVKSGVNGIVLEIDTPAALFECIRDVQAGRRWINQAVMQATLDRALGRITSPLDQLTAREKQVADLAARGRSTGEIAALLKVTAGTVKVHFHNIYKKLGLKNRTELVLRVRDAQEG